MSLIAHYPLNGNAKDHFGNDGVPSNVVWVDGKIGQAGDFDGSAHIILPNIDRFKPIAEVSHSVWIKPDQVSANVRYCLFMFGRDTNSGTLVYTGDNSTYTFRINTTGGSINVNFTVPSNEWFHLVTTYHHVDGAKVYINGDLIASSATNGQIVYPEVYGAGLSLGSHGGIYYWEGIIDDFRYFDHALSEREVRDLSRGLATRFVLKSDSISDSSPLSMPVTNTNLPTWNGEYFAFDGTQYIDVDCPFSNSSDQVWTVSGWIFTSDVTRHQQFNNFNNANIFTYSTSKKPLLYLNGGENDSYVYGPVVSNDTWYHVAYVYNQATLRCDFYINGVQYSSNNLHATDVPSGLPTTMRFGNNLLGGMKEIKVYATDLSTDEVLSEYKTGLAVDDQHRMHSAYLNESGIINPNLLDYTTWDESTSGSVTGFDKNGETTENHRVQDVDPFGKTITIWEARPEAESGSDGGWNGSRFPIDNTKLYRFSVWVKRTVKGNGHFYLGTRGYDDSNTNIGVRRYNDTTIFTNPYFETNGHWSETWNEVDKWYLVVGHVFPFGTGVLASPHQESGIYDEDGNFVDAIENDFVWLETCTQSMHRSYLYYSTDTTTRQQWCYPRVDVVDGTEPSIEALLTGFDSLNYERTHDELGSTSVPDHLGVKREHSDVGQFSEVGIDRGMVLWFPLKGDAKDRVSNEVATVNGAVPTADGYSFDGVDDHILTGYGNGRDVMANPITLSGWVQSNTTSANQMWFDVGTNGSNQRFYAGLVTASQANFGIQDSVWQSGTPEDTDLHHQTIVMDNGSAKFYDNGILVHTKLYTTYTLPGDIIIGGRGTSYSWDGLILNIKIFETALTPEEVAQEYASTKAHLNKSTAFAKEFIEV